MATWLETQRVKLRRRILNVSLRYWGEEEKDLYFTCLPISDFLDHFK